MIVLWTTNFSREAGKQYEKLKRSGSKKPSIIDTIDLLMSDLELNGPVLHGWPNYGIIGKGTQNAYYHCHLKKGNPTYVACWKIINENKKKIEVFNVGSHENAPY